MKTAKGFTPRFFFGCLLATAIVNMTGNALASEPATRSGQILMGEVFKAPDLRPVKLEREHTPKGPSLRYAAPVRTGETIIVMRLGR